MPPKNSAGIMSLNSHDRKDKMYEYPHFPDEDVEA